MIPTVFISSLVVTALIPTSAVWSLEERTNVLLIVADDLGPHLQSYGDHTVPTPNLDRLARGGVRFENLTLDNAEDRDFFAFSVDSASATISVDSEAQTNDVSLALFEKADNGLVDFPAPNVRRRKSR